MDQISEHINFKNHKNHYVDHMRKIIVNVGCKKGTNNENWSLQLSCPHNSLLMSIVEAPKKDLSNFEEKSDTIKVHTSSVDSSSTLSCVQYMQCIIKFIVINTSHVKIVYSQD